MIYGVFCIFLASLSSRHTCCGLWLGLTFLVFLCCSRPLTFSEELASLAAKVDFHEGWDKNDGEEDEEIIKGESVETGTEEKDLESSKVSDQWPWEDVRNKLR